MSLACGTNSSGGKTLLFVAPRLPCDVRRNGVHGRHLREAHPQLLVERSRLCERSLVDVGFHRRSTSIAIPWPPPTHIVSSPIVPSRVSRSFSSVHMIRAPVIP